MRRIRVVQSGNPSASHSRGTIGGIRVRRTHVVQLGESECVALANWALLDEVSIGQCDALVEYNWDPSG